MPNQTPEPPRVTDGQIAEWERDLKLARKPSAADECVYARDEIFNVAMPRLLAEVKRLKADLAWWNANTIPDAEFPHHPRFPADPRAPRTTERL